MIGNELTKLKPLVNPSPLKGYEYCNGYGVFGAPFTNGHVLALRVFPESDFGAYTTLWHRSPQGDWSIYVDAPDKDKACPRYYGNACSYIAYSRISLVWSTSLSLEIKMDTPNFYWKIVLKNSRRMDILNFISYAMPENLWRTKIMLKFFESIAFQLLGLGNIKLSGYVPNGHYTILMPRRLYFMEQCSAYLENQDLGKPSDGTYTPFIGEVPLPARPVLAVGRGYFKI